MVSMASGQCYGCATSFGLFKKEHGCKNCGFAYCSKCLLKSIEIPKLNNAKHHVCNRCHEILTGTADRERERQEREKKAAPDAYYKRMAALNDESSAADKCHYGQSYSSTPTSIKAIPPQYRGLSRIDAELAMRLQKLKEKPNQPVTTDQEIADRLAKLKGSNPEKATTPQATSQAKTKYYHPPERRSEQEQIDDLLNEIADEVQIEDKFDPVKDVEERLVRFKDEPPRKGVPERKASSGNNLDSALAAPSKSYSKSTSGVSGGRSSRELSLTEVSSLIAATARDMELDAQKAVEGLQKDREIMDRLNQLKKKKNVKIAGVEGSDEDNEQQDDSEDEELAAKKIIKQYLEEVKLEERLGDIPTIDGTPMEAESKEINTEKPKKHSPNNKGESSKEEPQRKKEEEVEEEFDPDELPYCCICTNDATTRCLGCDFDLYCDRCFREAHEKLDIEDHIKIKYIPPKESSLT